MFGCAFRLLHRIGCVVHLFVITLSAPKEKKQQRPQLQTHSSKQNISICCHTRIWTMFSWSTDRPNPTGSIYPASRSTSTPLAQIVQGSIRPPELTRAQHLQSFLNDDVLKKSTRRVSTGNGRARADGGYSPRLITSTHQLSFFPYRRFDL